MPRTKNDNKSSGSKRKDSPIEEVDDAKRARTDGETTADGRDLGHVLAGYKGTITNPNTSEEAKQNAEMMLEKLGGESSSSTSRNERLNRHGKDIRGLMDDYKRTADDESHSEEKRTRARNTHSELSERYHAGGHLGHVIGGYKATLTNANTSEEAKENARQMLEELGAEDYEYTSKPGDEQFNKSGKDIKHYLSHYKGMSEDASLTDTRRSHALKTLAHLEETEKASRHLGHVIGGYRAALSNAATSDEAREHALQMLEELDADDYDRAQGRKSDEDKDFNRVMGGYKATLSNPAASEEAKEHAREVLADNNVSENAIGKDDSEKNPGNVIGGLKAALKNPHTSEEAKDDVRAKLNEKIASV